MPNVLFLDAAYTLIHPNPSVGALYAAEARRHGVEADAAALEQAFRAVFEELRQGEPSHTPPYGTTEVEARAYWSGIVAKVFQRAGHVMPGGTFFRDLFDLFGRGEAWLLDPDAHDVITMARDAGWRVAVLSNFDTRLHSILRDHRVAEQVDAVLVSCDLGWEKPSPAIYAAALERLGVGADDLVAMVGDSRREDHDVPRSLGWRAALLDPRANHAAAPNTQRAATLREAVGLVLS